ncbi:MAG: S1/P1 nuclease [Gammaproteobacteria bacterium]
MKPVFHALLSCLLFGLPGYAFAWDSFGHMVVASVAWQNLDAPTRDKVITLLKKNPDYDRWIKNVSAANRDEYAFMEAATWADDIKSDSAHTDDNDTPAGPHAARNVGYADILRHRYWHYIDFPFSPDNTPLGAPDPVNLQTQIHAFRLKLKSSTASASLRSCDLVWLLHLVGDAHQPLHSTSRFTAALPMGDHGGGGVQVCPSSCSTTAKQALHTFWDDQPGTGNDRRKAHLAAMNLPAANPAAAAAIDDEQKWLEESFELAKNDVYVAPVKNGKGPYALSAAYNAHAKQVAQQRLALAGARLARVIEESF